MKESDKIMKESAKRDIETAHSAMEWSRLISNKRLGMEEYHDAFSNHTRSDFQRDYDRLIFSSPFRRLQNKTQVFPLPGSVFVHNRLTHSLEVSSVGRSMANEVMIGLLKKYAGEPWKDTLFNIGDIVATACLSHDLGNPPFGHSGEKAISTFFSEGAGGWLRDKVTPEEWADLVNFEGNANSFRLLTHRFVGRREGGFAMTYSTLASIVKYPHSSIEAGEKGKFGYFTSENEVWHRVAGELGLIPLNDIGRYARHPLVYIMEAADDICYQIMDLEDAHKLKVVSYDDVRTLFMDYFEPSGKRQMEKTMEKLNDPNEKIAYLRSKVIGAMVGDCARVFLDNEDAILSGKFRSSLVDSMEHTLCNAYSGCSSVAWDKIYSAPEVVEIELAGNKIISYLMERLVDAVMYPNKNYSQLLLKKIPTQYDARARGVFDRLQSVLDHVSGMTDVYALDLFRKLNGHSLPAV